MPQRLMSLALASVLLALPALAQQQPTITYKSTAVVPGLYMLEGEGGFAGGNIGLFVGDDGVFLIDDGLPPLTETLLGAIKKLTNKPVDYLVNTHAHGDHIGGNVALAEAGATIVSHHKLRRRMVDEGLTTREGQVPAPKASLPVLTFSEEVSLHLNDKVARIFHVEHAHTDGDAVIHFQDDNVIHTGDVMFNGLFPFIDLDSGGSVEGYIAAQRRILLMADEQTKIIPGHGPLASRDDLRKAVEMLEDAYATVRKHVREGKTADEIVAANPLAGYHDAWNWGFITTEGMTRTLVRALTEE